MKIYKTLNSLLNAMKKVDHGIKGNKNPYHLEGSVYTHTMMVYGKAADAPLDKRDHAILLQAALMHDAGKIYAGFIKDNKKYFIGHEGIGFYISQMFSSDRLVDYLVWLHGVMYRKNYNSIQEMIDDLKLYRYGDDIHSKRFYRILLLLIKADHAGRKTKQNKRDLFDKIDRFLDELETADFEYKHPDPNKANIIIPQGVQCCGKSTLFKNEYNNLTLISRDDIRVKIATDEAGISDYNSAYEYIRKNNLEPNVTNIVNKMISDAVKNNKSIFLDEMNLNGRKVLKRFINMKKYNIVWRMVTAPFDVIFERNKQRSATGKYIPEYVIINSMRKILP
jgi:predicted kinase